MKTVPVIAMPPDQVPDTATLAEILRVLRAGSPVVLPTDTVYGVAADARRADAAGIIARTKERTDRKPIPLLAADAGQIAAWGAEFTSLSRALAAAFWPGALTLVLPCGNQWEGFRVPASKVTLAILRAMGYPLRVSSANVSGAAPALTAADAIAALRNVALAVDSGPAPGGVASTVLKVESSRCVILRQGALPAAALARICETHETHLTEGRNAR